MDRRTLIRELLMLTFMSCGKNAKNRWENLKQTISAEKEDLITIENKAQKITFKKLAA